MWEAFGWGTLAASSLVIGAVIALLIRIPLRVIGLIMGFGAGVLISAVAFDLVQEAAEKSSGQGWAVDRLGDGDRKDAAGAQKGGSSLGSCSAACSTGSPSRW